MAVFLQWVFIGRSIVDNILLAQEMVKGYGHFKGARGLRQGDPLSPTLFVLAMHVFSKMFNLAAEKRVFGYHQKCKKIGLIHLSFAEDVMIFCKGNADSIMGVLSVLDQFYETSGLHLNSSKCITLVTRKLSKKDCGVLIDKIKQRLHHRSTRNLSYAGRLELIRYVLFSVSNYWWRQFILPQSVLLKVDQIRSRFFWKGEDKAAAGARVSWEFICLGLDLKNTKTWNKACIIDLTRKILAGDGFLWVAWFKNYVLKDHEFWSYVAGSNLSWTLRDIWDAIRNKGEKVSWHKLIWFPMPIPKFSFITWMVLLNRLPTRDRLLKMGINSEGTCVNCNIEQETRNHIFFSQCPLVVRLWNSIMSLNGLKNAFLTWDDMVTRDTKTWKGKSLLTTILKISWTAYIYILWEERNYRIFQGRNRTIEDMIKAIKEAVIG
ncbi:uncharacterized protein LOC120179189 [Hibiscus syriacus]|uniref:uncharacterized protein LOC120179189 n=1 Tax=Hibiscus syriacus TaxID=106335 RepID=UPI0019211453|nr:uncharacterized protein LOC120179189 [Hibiscus syriacus]